MKCSIQYRVSENVQRAELRAQGKAGPTERSAEFDLFALAPDVREMLIQRASALDLERDRTLSFSLREYYLGENGDRKYLYDRRVVFDVAMPAQNELEAALRHELNAPAELRAEADAFNKALDDAKRAEREQRERAEAERKEKQRAEKIAWAAQFGSDHLQRALAAGHSCDRKYRVERAAVEYPGFTLDYENNAGTKDRACPSVEALDARDAALAAHPDATCEIVWLAAPALDSKPQADDEEDFEDDAAFEEREALVVKDPRYNHDLVKEL